MRASRSYIGSGSETESPRTVSSCPPLLLLRLFYIGCVECFHVGGVFGGGDDRVLDGVVVFRGGEIALFYGATLGKGGHGAVGDAWIHNAIAALYGAVVVAHTIVGSGQRLGIGIG